MSATNIQGFSDCLPVTIGTDFADGKPVAQALYFASAGTISIITPSGATRSSIKVVAGRFDVQCTQVAVSTVAAADIQALF